VETAVGERSAGWGLGARRTTAAAPSSLTGASRKHDESFYESLLRLATLSYNLWPRLPTTLSVRLRLGIPATWLRHRKRPGLLGAQTFWVGR